jgi:hypothetical protein
MGSSAAAVATLLREHGYASFRTGRNDAGLPTLAPAGDLSAPAPRPNVFATVDPERARRRGVVVL